MKNDVEQLRKWGIWSESIAFIFLIVGLILARNQGHLIWAYWVYIVNAIFFAIIAVGLKVNALYYRK